MELYFNNKSRSIDYTPLLYNFKYFSSASSHIVGKIPSLTLTINKTESTLMGKIVSSEGYLNRLRYIGNTLLVNNLRNSLSK